MPAPYCYDYPRPMVTVDLVVFAVAADGLRALFIKRKKDPFAGRWAIPGGYLEIDEPIAFAARRELEEETGLKGLPLVEEIGVFGTPDRDPRGRTISVAHAAILPGGPSEVIGGDDAAEARWLDPAKIEGLAFDHKDIVDRALGWLTRGVAEGRLALALLPERFGKKDAARVWRAVGMEARGDSRTLRRLAAEGRIRTVEDARGGFAKV